MVLGHHHIFCWEFFPQKMEGNIFLIWLKVIQMGANMIFLGVDKKGLPGLGTANFLGFKFREKISVTVTSHQVVLKMHRNAGI